MLWIVEPVNAADVITQIGIVIAQIGHHDHPVVGPARDREG